MTIAVLHPWLDNSSLRRLANGGCETTPILRHRLAPGCRTFQRQFAARAWKLDDDDLPAVKRSAAAVAATLVVEGMPDMMKYRADVSGGKLEIESRRGRGTTVTCRVPLNREK